MELQKQIYSYLNNHQLMSVATVGGYPWPAIVYYLPDEDLDLYFVSSPEDEHSLNIAKNPQVACAIFDSAQPFSGEKVGIQYSGEAKIVTTLERLKWMVKFWNKLIAGEKGSHFEVEDFKAAGKSRVYQITPSKVKFFNTRDFKEPKFRVWKK